MSGFSRIDKNHPGLFIRNVAMWWKKSRNSLVASAGSAV